VYSKLQAAAAFALQTLSLTQFKGRTIRIELVSEEDNGSETSFVLDDFVIVVEDNDWRRLGAVEGHQQRRAPHWRALRQESARAAPRAHDVLHGAWATLPSLPNTAKESRRWSRTRRS
jgi:hypothetical protein